ncbi:MAG: TolC family protein [Phycisphaerae bacterium]|nr:TolC family protein [Phycisphaerae bacterium]
MGDGKILGMETITAAALLVTGCAYVDPRPDYARAGRLIEERTAAEVVYDPAKDEAAAACVGERLVDGLTVDEAVDVALLNNPSLRASFAALAASRADIVQAGMLTNPSFSLGLQFPEGGGRSKINLGFAQQVADLWQIPVRKKIAEADLEQAICDVAAKGLATAAEARKGCFRLLAAEQVLATLQEGQDLAERVRSLADAQFKAGEVNRLDLSLAQVAALNIDLELLSIERQRTAARLDLARTLGLCRDEGAWVLVGGLPCPTMPIPDDGALVTTALLQRLDVRSSLANVARAETQVALEHRKVFSDVGVGVDFERPDQRSLPGRKVFADTVRSSIAAGQLTAPSIQSRGERRIEKAQIIDSLLGPSLTITVPLWDQNQAQIAKARALALQQRHNLEALLDTVVTEVRQAAETARTAQAQVELYEDQVLPEADRNAALALDLYQAGEESILAVLDAQKSRLRLRQSYVESRRDCATAFADLELALGGRLDAIGVATNNDTGATDEEN